MLTGIHSKSIDPKNRLVIPMEFRNELGDEVYLTYSNNACVRLYSKVEYEKIVEKIRARKAEGMDTRAVEFIFVMSARPVTYDTTGRILLSNDMRQRAKLEEESEALVVGNIDHVEIWNASGYMETMSNFTADVVEEQMRSIGEL